MSRIISLLAALAMTVSLAACASDDADVATTDDTEVTTDQATTDQSEDEAATDGESTDGESTDGESTDGESTDEMTDEGSADSLTVAGELTFDDAELEAGSTLVLRVTDLTDANSETALVAEETIDVDGTSPIPFSIMVPRADLDPGLRYALRAVINDASGNMILTTNSVNSVDVASDSSDLGTLELVSAS